MSLILKFAIGTCLTASLAAQTAVNCRLLANRNPLTGATGSRNNYAGMWGAVIGGRELAILPARSGTYIYDCSNPGNPVQLAMIPGPAPTNGTYWREAASLGNYAYISSEHGALQSINLAANPPVLASTFGSSAHSLQCDPTNSRLWANGGAVNGARIYDLTTSPTAPTLRATYTSAYVHDCFPRDGYCYLAQISAGNFRILDTRNFPTLTTLSTVTTPGSFTHNTWTNKDATLLVTTDENQGGCLAFYDITLKNLPVLLSTWCSPSGATVHNAFIKGKVVHLSSYTAGYYAVDISEPATPRLICSYDTNARTGSGYTGCWGAYPLQPSGTVYLADMEFGMFVVEPTCGAPVEYGTGTPGTGGKTPVVDYGGGFAQVGRSTFKLECTDMLPNAPAALFVGTAAATTPIFGITLNVDLALPYVQVLGSANAQGRLDVTVPIPAQANLAGGTIYAQVVAADVAGPQGLSASRGFRVAICP
jgi:choice-of-anchor B domain-containing protein